MNIPEIKYRIKYFLMSNPSEVIEKKLSINSGANIRNKFKEEIGLHGMEIISIEEYSEETERWSYASA